MAVLVLVETQNGKVKKSGREAATYAADVAAKLGTGVVAVALGEADDLDSLGAQGVTKVLKASGISAFDSGVYAKAIAAAAEQEGADVVVISHSTTGKAVAPRVAARLQAGLVSGAIAAPETDNGFVVKATAFSNKGYANYEITSAKKVIAIIPNSYGVKSADGSAEVAAFDAGVSDADAKVKVTNVELAGGGIPLPEAEKVVSAGRGLKGPENWGMVEDLAKTLSAATACSRPVSDVGWRPHHEHVGQTGIAISPNLYIAIGISGAIQHLAGVSSSKNIVVINNDPEAPFFKNADYGVVGDAFDVVPRLNEALKKYFASNN